MLDTKDLLEHAERCRTLADLSQMSQVSQRLRVLAQRYTEQAQDIEHQRAAEALPRELSGKLGDDGMR